MSVVTICGFTRFPDELAAAHRDLTFAGHIVFGVDLFGDLTAAQKQTLDDLDDAKIRMSDWVHGVNPGGYLGESTWREALDHPAVRAALDTAKASA